MAIEEIRVARAEESIGTQDGNVYARNKALQSAGMGVELVYKTRAQWARRLSRRKQRTSSPPIDGGVPREVEKMPNAGRRKPLPADHRR